MIKAASQISLIGMNKGRPIGSVAAHENWAAQGSHQRCKFHRSRVRIVIGHIGVLMKYNQRMITVTLLHGQQYSSTLGTKYLYCLHYFLILMGENKLLWMLQVFYWLAMVIFRFLLDKY